MGGDRFAPNVLSCPDGFYYGNLDPDERRRGRCNVTWPALWLDEYLRGMVRYPPPVQAAVVAAYERCPPLGPGQITVRSVNQIGPMTATARRPLVDLEVATLRTAFRVEMLSVRRPEAKLTCRAPRETPATEYRTATVSLARRTDESGSIGLTPGLRSTHRQENGQVRHR